MAGSLPGGEPAPRADGIGRASASPATVSWKPPIACLWDFGWVLKDLAELPRAALDVLLLQGYVASAAFHTFFVPRGGDQTGIHGPFRADRPKSGDFIACDQDGFEAYLERI